MNYRPIHPTYSYSLRSPILRLKIRHMQYARTQNIVPYPFVEFFIISVSVHIRNYSKFLYPYPSADIRNNKTKIKKLCKNSYLLFIYLFVKIIQRFFIVSTISSFETFSFAIGHYQSLIGGHLRRALQSLNLQITKFLITSPSEYAVVSLPFLL
jgi:hypothetical protein